MHRKMNFLISALFTLIVSSAVTAQTPAPAPGPGVYTGGIAPRATPPGLNGTYQPGVITTQPPAPGTGVYTTNDASIAPRATPPGLNGTYQAPIQGAGAVGGTAYRSTTYNTNASAGQVGGGQLLTGPDVSAGTAPTTRANNGYGSYTRSRSLTGVGGGTSSGTATVGSGAYSTYGRTRSGSTYNGTQSSSTYGASRNRP